MGGFEHTRASKDHKRVQEVGSLFQGSPQRDASLSEPTEWPGIVSEEHFRNDSVAEAATILFQSAPEHASVVVGSAVISKHARKIWLISGPWWQLPQLSLLTLDILVGWPGIRQNLRDFALDWFPSSLQEFCTRRSQTTSSLKA